MKNSEEKGHPVGEETMSVGELEDVDPGYHCTYLLCKILGITSGL